MVDCIWIHLIYNMDDFIIKIGNQLALNYTLNVNSHITSQWNRRREDSGFT